MSRKKPAANRPPAPTRDEWVRFWKDQPEVSGSRCAELTAVHTSQLARALWYGAAADPELAEIQQKAALQSVAAIGPRDAIEGLLAAQMVASHVAAMECFRRAHLPEQPFAGRELALRYADKLVRSCAALVEVLDRHRGKGQPQVVRVERVTVEAGGQAIVGAVAQGGGGHGRSEDQPHARAAITHAPEPVLRGADPQRAPVPAAAGRG
jgi:hypothetical protein